MGPGAVSKVPLSYGRIPEFVRRFCFFVQLIGLSNTPDFPDCHIFHILLPTMRRQRVQHFVPPV